MGHEEVRGCDDQRDNGDSDCADCEQVSVVLNEGLHSLTYSILKITLGPHMHTSSEKRGATVDKSG